MSFSGRILGIDPGLRITGFGSGRSHGSLNRPSRLAFTETSHSIELSRNL
jgi:Holliday junction resolvasome RuvABC endonuclease subunit